MTFQEKVKFLRSLPAFKVAPISEIRAVAFVIREAEKPDSTDYIVGESGTISLILTQEDIEKIVREYPDVEACLPAGRLS